MRRKKGLKRTPFKRLRLTSLKELKRQAWQAFARYIRTRDPWCVTCEVEGRRTPTAHAGHYRHNSERSQSLGGNELWYDIRNIHGQCVGCNNYKSGNLEPYAIYMTRKYGHGVLEEINRLYRTYKKYTRDEIQEIIDRYSDIIRA